jgi:1-carboxybiuret hydrolase subunit AtzG-like protein
MPRKVAPRKAKPAARTKNKTKTAPKPTRPPQRSRAKKSDAIEMLMVAGAQALALPLEEAFKAGVRSNLQALLVHAARVDEFSLPDDIEPAPVFRA